VKIPSIFFRLWIVGIALLLPASPGRASPVRLSTFDLQPATVPAGAAGVSNEFKKALLRDAAASLRAMAPDVIILQHVADWETCRQLAQSLQPENYQVAICSSFPKTNGGRWIGQVAILSRTKAYLAWSQAWQSGGGGFAFVAIRLSGKNAGIFSVQADGENAPRLELARQIASLQSWKNNRLDALVVAGNFYPGGDVLRLKEIGFESAFADTGLAAVFTRGIGRVIPGPTTQLPFRSAACAFDLSASKPALTAALPAPRSDLPAPGAVAKRARPGPPWLLLCSAGILLVCSARIFLLRRRARRSELRAVATPREPGIVPLPLAQDATLVADDPVRAGIVANLSRWLKGQLVQCLLSDRAQLMAAQEVAALKVLAVDERLTKIERQIQQRQQDYEQRIDQLANELEAAKEENRELIRAKIALVKAEMERARLRAAHEIKERRQP
jgi:hypothetical protein